MSGLASRVLDEELMDQPGLDTQVHIAALSGLERVNWISGTDGLIWRSLMQFRSPFETEPLRVLDLACGGGDVAIHLAQHANRTGIPLVIEGCDISPTAIDFAQGKADSLQLSNVRFFRRDVLHDPFASIYDVVMSSLFMHHLSDLQAVLLLQRMAAASRRGFLLDDLNRSRLGYFLAWWGVRLLSRSAIVHADGPASVRAAFNLEEARQLAAQAGLKNISILRHWPQRFLMTWQRPISDDSRQETIHCGD